MLKFKNMYTFEERKLESERIKAKYPDRVPVICEKLSYSNMKDIDKKKYLVPSDLTCGQFLYVIRKRLDVKPEQGVFLFLDGKIPSSTSIMSDIYHSNKDGDGFLYMNYSNENVFGNE